jgi:hypothetical protein
VYIISGIGGGVGGGCPHTCLLIAPLLYASATDSHQTIGTAYMFPIILYICIYISIDIYVVRDNKKQHVFK